MPNIASILKSEIARIARKEMRAETDSLKKASTQYRSTIAVLKRQVAALERELKQLSKGVKREAPAVAEPSDGKIRYSAKRLADHRAKLGLSAKDYGALIGVSPLSIYKWEGGDVRPRDKQLRAIAAVRKLGKREAAARLEELGN
jgi:DNA-binding transcriptional regulator YiaG